MSTASTTWNSSWASSRKTTWEKTCMPCLWTLYLNLLDAWPGRTQTSRRRPIFSPSLLITLFTTHKTVTCGFWSQLVSSIESEEYRYSTRLNSSRRYCSTIFYASIFITVQGHSIDNRIHQVFIKWTHFDPHDPRALSIFIYLLRGVKVADPKFSKFLTFTGSNPMVALFEIWWIPTGITLVNK